VWLQLSRVPDVRRRQLRGDGRYEILEGSCGDVDLSGVKAIAVVDWPKAIHDGNGKAVFIVAPETTDEQIQCLSQIYTGQLGGDPWGDPRHDVRGRRAREGTISFEGTGVTATMTAEGLGRATSDTFKNPVTDEPHQAQIVLPEGLPRTFGSTSPTPTGSSTNSTGRTIDLLSRQQVRIDGLKRA
jgi:hypothetical protein